ncbi:MAG TPA: YkyA family protein [Candidatus Atopostipes pullistercoris]|uniref:YkyA family protein n=1 Tax=Candidatus Atopostipes pullistercoris TaxID=2838467 RepID=A0A9D2G2W1_9LACT|nr:YkyA family protein [Candidatus Atopostipes pullistercoris]
MSKKLYLSLTLSSSLILTACGSRVSVKDVEESADELNTSLENIVEANHQLNESELAMDNHFSTVLAEDKELTTLQDESASVMENVSEREMTVENINEYVETINDQANTLQNYEGTDLPEETIQQISDSLLDFTQQIEAYQERYIQSLAVQKDYLQDIASKEATYEEFIDGIDAVNEDYQSLQEETYALDEHFSKVAEQIDELNTLVAEESSEVDSSSKAATANEKNSEENEDDDAKTEETEAEADEEVEPETDFLVLNYDRLLTIPNHFPQKFVYDSGVDIPYPEDGVKGIYVTAHSASGSRMEYLTDLINNTDLNTMVIDIKDDYGNVTLNLNSDNELINEMTVDMIDAEELMNVLEENNIYPIARIVVFKDTLLAKQKPEWSFTRSDGNLWSNNKGDSFVNPYLTEVWDYNLEIATQAAKLGFKEIQFDYVRFPEGFEKYDKELDYGHGHYGDDDVDVINMKFRNQAVTDFVSYAREQLQPFGVDVSVDIFGYAAVVRETEGIGQSFPGIAKEVDVISSMIYPSHWGLGNLDIAIPDLEPYNVVNNYMQIESEIFDELGDDAPSTRPWLQDFTASYLGAGNYKNYGAAEVTDQVRALADNGIHEFLLWNAGNTYSEGATYTFE